MIDISNLNNDTRIPDVKKKALEFAAAFKTMSPVKNEPNLDNSAIQYNALITNAVEAVQRLSPNARIAFMFFVGRDFGGLQAFEVVRGYHKEVVNHHVLRVSTLDEASTWVVDDMDIKHWDELIGISWTGRRGISLPATICIVVPIGTKFDLDAETHTHTWATYVENTYASGTENYVDVYSSAELGLKVPLVEKIATFDVKTGVKVGEKHYKKTEEKEGQRFGAQTSKTFVVTKIGRNTLEFYPGLVNEAVINPFAVQHGYVAERKDLNKKLGEHWNSVSWDGTETNSGYEQTEEDIQKIIDETGLEMARRVRRMKYSPPTSSAVPAR